MQSNQTQKCNTRNNNWHERLNNKWLCEKYTTISCKATKHDALEDYEITKINQQAWKVESKQRANNKG
jgi:hypothetical protein